MRIYISGKIGELEPIPSTIEKFAKAEEKLRARGFDVFNPIRMEILKKRKLFSGLNLRLQTKAIPINRDFTKPFFYLTCTHCTIATPSICSKTTRDLRAL